jgi:hypothetical protein
MIWGSSGDHFSGSGIRLCPAAVLGAAIRVCNQSGRSSLLSRREIKAAIKFTRPPNPVRHQNLAIAPRRAADVRREVFWPMAFRPVGLQARSGAIRTCEAVEEVQRRGGDPLTPATLVLLNETAKAAVIGFEDAAFPARVDCKARRDQRVRALCAFAARLPRRIRADRRLRLPGRG